MAFFEIYKDYQQRKKETMKTDADRQKAAAAEEEATAEEAAAEAQAEAAQSEPEPEPEPEPQPETVEASPEAAAEAPPAEAAAETVAAVEEPPTGAPPPAPEPDWTFELMVEVLGDDLNDENIGRLAEKLDPQKRAAFLAAVEAKRTSAAAPVADAPVEAAPAPPVGPPAERRAVSVKRPAAVTLHPQRRMPHQRILATVDGRAGLPDERSGKPKWLSKYDARNRHVTNVW